MLKKLYGFHTERAIRNFPISGWTMPAEFLRALALIKEHAARVNGELKEIPKRHANAIARAAVSIARGKHLDQFPVDVFQTGSGTSTNMNMNEVIATLATTPSRNIHPLDHVNRCQSSNDVIPTALQIACALKVRDELLPALTHLENVLHEKSREFHAVVKTGRTHLMDAVPVRLGEEFASYAFLLERAATSLLVTGARLNDLPLGGTAVGTGLNAHPRFARRTIAALKKATGLPLRETANHLASQSCPLALQGLSSALREIVTVLAKMADDIRLMASGPVAGFTELHLPELQPGSSIMPGKVNPVLCESIEQVAACVVGIDATVTCCLNRGSRFELHTCLPLLAAELLPAIGLIANVARAFADKCIRGIRANEEAIRERLERSPMLVTALAKRIGYDNAARIAKEACATGETILAVALRRTNLPREELAPLLDPRRMV